jgi:hypothetical protein
VRRASPKPMPYVVLFSIFLLLGLLATCVFM